MEVYVASAKAVANLLIPTAGLKHAEEQVQIRRMSGRQPINPNCGTETCVDLRFG